MVDVVFGIYDNLTLVYVGYRLKGRSRALLSFLTRRGSRALLSFLLRRGSRTLL